MPKISFADATPEQRAEWERKKKETRERNRQNGGITNARTVGGGARPRSGASSAGATTRAEIRSAIETVNLLMVVGGLGKYALTEEELTAETDALYVVCADTPGLGKLLLRGSRFTAWGKLLWVNYVILVRRRLMPDAGGFVARSESERGRAPAPAPVESSPGPTHSDPGSERLGEDDTPAPVGGDEA